MLLNISTGPATKLNLSGIAEFQVPADQTASIRAFYIAGAPRTDLLLPSRRIVGSYIPACRWEAAATEP